MTSADDLIANAKGLLLDFDGPVTALMPPPQNAEAADLARKPLDGLALPDNIRVTTDHLAVLRWTHHNKPARLLDVENACTTAEVACAQTSQPSSIIGRLLHLAQQLDVPLAIVSNNSEEAVRVFLERQRLDTLVSAYACRSPETARLLKPNPFLVTVGAALLDVDPRLCVFIGDSVTDVEAGLAAGTTFVGAAKSPQRAEELTRAGARALIHLADPLSAAT